MTNSPINHIPEGMHSVTPQLICAGAADAIEFYKKAFGATETSRMPGPAGKLMHASIRIGDPTVMLVDEMPEWGSLGPKALKGSSVVIHLYIKDVDAFTAKAVATGKNNYAGGRHVLGRSIWPARRSVRPSMVRRYARSRCQPGRDATVHAPKSIDTFTRSK
jgi:uncharacterized glyoxalase superfamily protein PhnB